MPVIDLRPSARRRLAELVGKGKGAAGAAPPPTPRFSEERETIIDVEWSGGTGWRAFEAMPSCVTAECPASRRQRSFAPASERPAERAGRCARARVRRRRRTRAPPLLP